MDEVKPTEGETITNVTPENQEDIEKSTEENLKSDSAETFKEENSSDEIEPEEEDDDVFNSLAGFSADILTSLGTPAEPLDLEQRHPRPLSPQGHDLTYTIRLLQVWNLYLKI